MQKKSNPLPKKPTAKTRRLAQQQANIKQQRLAEQQRLQQSYRTISTGIVALLASVAAYAATAKVALLVYRPNLEEAIETAKKTLAGGSNPEPVESFLYNIGVLSIPLFMVGFCLLLTKTRLSSIKWERCFRPLSVGFVLLVAGLLYAGLHAPNPNFVEVTEGNNFANGRDVGSDTNFKFYFLESVLSKQPVLYFGLFVPLIFGLTLLFRRFSKQLVKPLFMQIVGLLLVLGYAAVYLAQVYQVFSFDFPYTWENKMDFNVVYYPITQVYAGSPMLVDGFACNYGLYSHFLNPVFQVFGLSVRATTTVMALLIALIFVLMLVAMLRMVKSKLLVFLGFSTILFLCMMLSRAVMPFDAYFALFPIRQLLPAITLCVAAFYLKRKSRILYYAAFTLLGFGILWNPEFSIVSLLAWLVTLCYTEFSATGWRPIALACAKHLARAAVVVSLCIAAFSLSIRVQHGVWPQLAGLFSSMIYFGSLGVGMLPMTLRHPWNFVVLIYLIGLIYAMQSLFNKSTLNAKSAFILLLSVMGIGLFTYFQGRSHNWNLLAVAGNAIILLVVFADSMLRAASIRRSPLSFHVAVVAIIAVLGFSCIDLFRHQDRWKALYEQKAEKKANAKEQQQIENNIAFIKKNLPTTTEKIYIHTSNKYQSLYFDFTKKRSAFNPSISDIFTIENCKRLQNKMLLDTFDVFIEPSKFYYPYVQGVNAAMCATYSVDTANEQMYYMKKRRYCTPEQPVLDESQSPQTLVYEKFGDDTASLNRRIRCATEGKEPLAWATSVGDQLSMEVIFFAGQQAYAAGTLFSNYDDSAGVWLLNNGAPEKYLFQWGKSWGISLDVAPNKWCYIAVQVDKTLISIFVNGDLRYRYFIPAPVASTARRFYIAGDGQKNLHFTGAISEILVKKGLSSAQEIQARQKKIRDLL
jgi:hypothetical protein